MVRLSVWRDSEPRKIALRDAIQFELDTQQSTLLHKRLKIEIDLEAAIALLPCSPAICSTIETVLALAIDRSPRGGTLSIVGCDTQRGVELEVADDGTQAAMPRFRAFQSRECQPMGMGGNPSRLSYYGVPCPQGGMAWTIVLRQPQSIAKAA